MDSPFKFFQLEKGKKGKKGKGKDNRPVKQEAGPVRGSRINVDGVANGMTCLENTEPLTPI